jgi:hypothetical protein
LALGACLLWQAPVGVENAFRLSQGLQYISAALAKLRDWLRCSFTRPKIFAHHVRLKQLIDRASEAAPFNRAAR